MKKQAAKKQRLKNERRCSPSGGASSFAYIPHNIGAPVRSGINPVT